MQARDAGQLARVRPGRTKPSYLRLNNLNIASKGPY